MIVYKSVNNILQSLIFKNFNRINIAISINKIFEYKIIIVVIFGIEKQGLYWQLYTLLL